MREAINLAAFGTMWQASRTWTGIIVIGALLLSASVAFVTNWLALIPWRASKGKHWSEQARLAYPVFVAARSNIWTIPGICMLTVSLLLPDSSLLWCFTGVSAFAGAYAGTFPADREVFPRTPLRELLRSAVIGILIGYSLWFILIAAAVLMPDQFDLLALLIAVAVLVLFLAWSRGGLVWTARKLGMFVPAPERLCKIAADVSTRMAVPFREVLLMRSPVAQAFALPQTRQMLFTERLLELAPDDEVAAICAHELAHLTESRVARYSRNIRVLTFYPWIFYNPVVHAFGFFGFYGLLLISMLIPRIYRRISRKLESRADSMAKVNEGDAGAYARALARLYQDNLLPAVASKERATHPHLYDRLLAAGAVPDFPRPLAARTMAWHGTVFAVTLGILFAVLAIRKMRFSEGAN